MSSAAVVTGALSVNILFKLCPKEKIPKIRKYLFGDKSHETLSPEKCFKMSSVL